MNQKNSHNHNTTQINNSNIHKKLSKKNAREELPGHLILQKFDLFC